MRQFISNKQYKEFVKPLRKDDNCCYIKLNGKDLKNKGDYFKRLSEVLQLNDTFHRNIDAYIDMMCDHYTYYNRPKIIFVIKHYDEFLKDEAQKELLLTLFDNEIIPNFSLGDEISAKVYCIK